MDGEIDFKVIKRMILAGRKIPLRVRVVHCKCQENGYGFHSFGKLLVCERMEDSPCVKICCITAFFPRSSRPFSFNPSAFAVILQENSTRVSIAQARMAAMSFENRLLVMDFLLLTWTGFDGLFRKDFNFIVIAFFYRDEEVVSGKSGSCLIRFF